MNYWRGMMDWFVDKEWICETCGQNVGLEWGLVHGQCRCNDCHTQYQMRANDKDRTILTIPKCLLKEEYKIPAKQAWEKYHIPINELTGEQWDEFVTQPIIE